MKANPPASRRRTVPRAMYAVRAFAPSACRSPSSALLSKSCVQKPASTRKAMLLIAAHAAMLARKAKAADKAPAPWSCSRRPAPRRSSCAQKPASTRKAMPLTAVSAAMFARRKPPVRAANVCARQDRVFAGAFACSPGIIGGTKTTVAFAATCANRSAPLAFPVAFSVAERCSLGWRYLKKSSLQPQTRLEWAHASQAPRSADHFGWVGHPP